MNAKRDDNRIPALLAALNTDGITPVNVEVNPTNHALKVLDGTTGTDHGTNIANRDDNRIPVLMGISSADGTTPIEIYADSSGNLLIKST